MHDPEDLRLVFMDQDKNIVRTKPWEQYQVQPNTREEKKVKSCYQGPVVVVSPPSNNNTQETEESKQDEWDRSETTHLLISEEKKKLLIF